MKPVVMLTDANVFLRFLRNDHPQHSPAAKKLIEEAAASRVILQVPEIVVADIFYTLTAPMMKIPRADRFLSVWRECGFYAVGHFVWVKRYASCVRHNQMRHEQAYLLAKGNPVPPKHPPSDVIQWTYTGNKLHPTQKSVCSLTPLIEAYSKPNGLVLDPFAGSGSTGVAALLARRRCLLIEKEADHYKTASARLERLPYHLTAPARN